MSVPGNLHNEGTRATLRAAFNSHVLASYLEMASTNTFLSHAARKLKRGHHEVSESFAAPRVRMRP